jgi:hypothetical protein
MITASLSSASSSSAATGSPLRRLGLPRIEEGDPLPREEKRVLATLSDAEVGDKL